VIDRIRVARWTVIGGILLTVGVAGAATRLKRPSAGDACLCTPDTQDRPAFAADARSISGARASLGRIMGLGGASSQTQAGSLPAYVGVGGIGTVSTRNPTASGGNAGTVAWGGKSRGIGAYSSSTSGRSPSHGGLWQLMSWGRHRSAQNTTTVVRQVTTTNPRSAGGTRPPASHSGTVSPTPPAAPPSGLFAEQTTPIPSLLGGGGGIPGIGGVGGGGGVTLGGGRGLATTPEPGSLILFGTGAIGLFGVLRRRRD
jgi:hypothetical protein